MFFRPPLAMLHRSFSRSVRDRAGGGLEHHRNRGTRAGQAADVLLAGEVPGSVGLVQITFGCGRLPRNSVKPTDGRCGRESKPRDALGPLVQVPANCSFTRRV